MRTMALRHATRAAHDRIELALPIMAPALTRARYLQIVGALHGYYAALPHVVTGGHLERLERDLRALGRAPSPACSKLPLLSSGSAVLGACYVIEGATLGGQIIRRHLAKTLRLDAANGAAFFIGYGDDTRLMWSQFSQRLELAVDFDHGVAVAAAIATFETLERWLATSLASS